MSIIESRVVPNTARVVIAAGMTLDLINKLGQTGLIPPYPLGSGTFLENHLGNFGGSVIVTRFLRKMMLDEREDVGSSKLSNKLINIMAFAAVALLNIGVESIITRPNPELYPDIAVGLLGSLLYLLAFPIPAENSQNNNAWS